MQVVNKSCSNKINFCSSIPFSACAELHILFDNQISATVMDLAVDAARKALHPGTRSTLTYESSGSADVQQYKPQTRNSRAQAEYSSDDRMNAVTSTRANHIIASWRMYEMAVCDTPNSKRSDTEWFRSTVNGNLWLLPGIDKATGQLRPPMANIPSRLTSAKDIDVPLSSVTQVNNTFINLSTRPAQISLERQKKTLGTDLRSQINKRQQTSSNLRQARFVHNSGILESVFTANELPMKVACVQEVLRQWAFGDSRSKVFKPLMKWSADERNYCPHDKTDKKGSKKRKQNFSKRKIVALCFFHFILTSSIQDYERTFTSITEKGKYRANYEKASKYVKDNKLQYIANNQNEWIELTERSIGASDVKEVLLSR